MKFSLEESLKIVNITDKDGFTLILRAAYDNNSKHAEVLIIFFKQRLARYLKQLEAEKHKLKSTDDLTAE